MTDPRLDAVLQPALGRLRLAISGVLDQVALQLGPQALSSTNNLLRQLMIEADRELQLKLGKIKQGLQRELASLAENTLQHSTSGQSYAPTDWSELSLVDNAQVERDVQADRLALLVTPACERQFETVSGYVAGLLDDSSPERNPLRPKLLTKALLDSLLNAGLTEDVAQVICQQLTPLLGEALSSAYEAIGKDMRAQGLQPMAMSVQKSRNSGATPLGGEHRRLEDAQTTSAEPQISTQPGLLHARAAQALGEMFGVSAPSTNDFLDTSAGAPLSRPNQAAITADFQHLLRQINSQAGRIGQDAIEAAGLTGAIDAPTIGTRLPGFAGPLMAVNQIRAHREDLIRASGGAPLDKMVIDIVAALFDQVLSDPKVAPEMARQIARMQMPVLRVALGDMNFFNSRKHPVRRFVNRVASLSASFEDYSQGSGAKCLAHITSLVDGIVEGDFDRMDLYEVKLRELESFIESDASQDTTEQSEIAALLSAKESDLRVHQRYMQILQRELLDVEVPDFVRDFLAQVWSHVLVIASSREGPDSPRVQRLKAAGRELILSVQPKGHPKLRQEFLQKLPVLMKDINEGLALIRIPEAQKQAFFAELLPAHAASLKQAPAHDLTQRLLEQRLKQVDSIAIPTREEAAEDSIPGVFDTLHEDKSLMSTSAFTAEEIKQAGFIPEAALSSGSLDIDLDLSAGSTDIDLDLSASDLDINLDTPPAPTAGLQLVHHIQKGTPYHMVREGRWQKVRLTWVSEGRTFFIFTAGGLHKQTISLTGRTLAKMCETGRFKAFEQAELLERATVRARKQLAALNSPTAH